MNTLKDYVDWKLAHSDKTAEAEGYPLIMENCKANKKMRQLQIYGDTVEAQSVGDLVTDETDINYGKYKIPVIQRGKNLFNIENLSAPISPNYAQWLDDRSGIIMGSRFTNGYSLGYLKNLCPDLKVGDKFVVSFDTNAIRNNRAVTYFYLVGASVQIDIGGKYTCIQAMLDSQVYAYSGQTENAYLKNIQLEIGDTVTLFEPYKEPITINVFLNEPLQKSDYIDFKNKKAVHYINGIAEEEAINVDLPKLIAKTSIIETNTSVMPNNIKGKYIKK